MSQIFLPSLDLTLALSFFFSGEKHSCECSQGDVAHLQEHQIGEEDGPRESQEASEEIPSSHSPVGAVLPELAHYAAGCSFNSLKT